MRMQAHHTLINAPSRIDPIHHLALAAGDECCGGGFAVDGDGLPIELVLRSGEIRTLAFRKRLCDMEIRPTLAFDGGDDSLILRCAKRVGDLVR